MDTWDEASLGDGSQEGKPPEMTTDDLVMMVGEANINLKHSERVVRYLKQRVEELLKSVSKERAISLELKNQVETVNKDKNSFTETLTRHNQEKESFHNRIVQLENQLQTVAGEREELKKTVQEFIEAEAEKKKAVKRKK